MAYQTTNMLDIGTTKRFLFCFMQRTNHGNEEEDIVSLELLELFRATHLLVVCTYMGLTYPTKSNTGYNYSKWQLDCI